MWVYIQHVQICISVCISVYIFIQTYIFICILSRVYGICTIYITIV